MVTIDFEKAFDSVGRLALKFYKYEPRLINVIVDLYVGGRRCGEMGGNVGGDRGYKWD